MAQNNGFNKNNEAHPALRLRTYDDFVKNVLAKKPYPANSNCKGEK